jgi:hemerythrin superfamily protein
MPFSFKRHGEEGEDDILTLLAADHHTVRGIFEQLETALGDSRDAIVKELIAELTLHTEAEEAVLYPFARSQLSGCGEFVDMSLAAHAQVSRLLDELQQGVPNVNSILATIMRDVERHAHEEETILFPRMRDVCDPEQLVALGDEIDRVKMRTGAPIATTTSRTIDLTESTLVDLTRDQLYQRATNAGIKGRSKMNKDQLIRALEESRR